MAIYPSISLARSLLLELEFSLILKSRVTSKKYLYSGDLDLFYISTDSYKLNSINIQRANLGESIGEIPFDSPKIHKS